MRSGLHSVSSGGEQSMLRAKSRLAASEPTASSRYGPTPDYGALITADISQCSRNSYYACYRSGFSIQHSKRNSHLPPATLHHRRSVSSKEIYTFRQQHCIIFEAYPPLVRALRMKASDHNGIWEEVYSSVGRFSMAMYRNETHNWERKHQSL